MRELAKLIVAAQLPLWPLPRSRRSAPDTGGDLNDQAELRPATAPASSRPAGAKKDAANPADSQRAHQTATRVWLRARTRNA